jgi:hypothetical protein
MDDFTAQILRHLVEGHEARAGMKERNRALTEYEIARRAGYTDFSYVEFSTTRERDQVRDALDELEREGWITQLPTELGVRRANTLSITRDLDAPSAPPMPTVASPPPSHLSSGGSPALAPDAALNRLVQQLDEALALLRAIDAKLGRDS